MENKKVEATVFCSRKKIIDTQSSKAMLLSKAINNVKLDDFRSKEDALVFNILGIKINSKSELEQMIKSRLNYKLAKAKDGEFIKSNLSLEMFLIDLSFVPEHLRVNEFISYEFKTELQDGELKFKSFSMIKMNLKEKRIHSNINIENVDEFNHNFKKIKKMILDSDLRICSNKTYLDDKKLLYFLAENGLDHSGFSIMTFNVQKAMVGLIPTDKKELLLSDALFFYKILDKSSSNNRTAQQQKIRNIIKKNQGYALIQIFKHMLSEEFDYNTDYNKLEDRFLEDVKSKFQEKGIVI